MSPGITVTLPEVIVRYTVSSDWGNGFTAEIRITNRTSSVLRDWNLALLADWNVSSIWNAKVTPLTNRRTFDASTVSWNRHIPANGSVSFGFSANPGRLTAPPTDLVFTHAGSATPPPAPTPTPETGSTKLDVQHRITSNWGSGMGVLLTLKNNGTQSVSDWSVAFDYPGQITSMWNGKLSSSAQTPKYTVRPETWNRTLAPGQSVEIGFNVSPGSATASPGALNVKP